jgi:hypothetical protein
MSNDQWQMMIAIGDQLAIDDLRELALQAPKSLAGGLDALEVVPLEGAILERAGVPFPTSLGTLDALHLATPLAIRDDLPGIVFATHDDELGLAASAMGFDVRGVDLAAGSG